MKPQWQGQTRGGKFGYSFFIFIIRYLGIEFAYGFLAFVVPYFIPASPKATKAIWSYSRRRLRLSRVKSVAMLLKNYYALGRILIDKVAIGASMSEKYTFLFDNYTPFINLLQQDKGVIMIGAHIGNWEIGVPFFDKYASKINIVMYDNEHRAIKEVLEKNSATREYNVITVNKDSLSHVFAISQALSNNEIVCFQGDRYINDEKLLRTVFMGKEADFPMGPFLLAAKMKASVVFYFAMREKGMRYRFHFRIADGKSMSDLLEQYKITLEEMLEKYPSQWFNYYDFWNDGQKIQ